MTFASIVCAVPELFEMIALEPRALTVGDLMHCRRVCTTWRDNIGGSLRVKQRMHLLPGRSYSSDLVTCDTLPACMTAVHLDAAVETRNSKIWPISVDIDVNSLLDLDTEPLRTILLLQPACKLNKWRGIDVTR